jgi:hypothetical protein
MSLQGNKLYRLFDGAPIRLRWGGWVSDTHLLRREGWRFSADEHYQPYEDCWAIRLAATDPDNNLVIAGVLRLPSPLHLERGHGYGGMFEDRLFGHGFDLHQYHTAKNMVRYMDAAEVASWKALTAVNMFEPTTATERQIVMRDFKVFQPESAVERIKEIYVPSESVDECLDRILQLQYPQQQEIKMGLIMPEAKPIIQAKILTLAA